MLAQQGFSQSAQRGEYSRRALRNRAPHSSRGDQVAQLVAKQKGRGHPGDDAGVALVDGMLAANRKKAAA